MSKIVNDTKRETSNRHNPLGEVIVEESSGVMKKKKKMVHKGEERAKRRQVDQEVLPQKLSRKILQQAINQQKEEEKEMQDDAENERTNVITLYSSDDDDDEESDTEADQRMYAKDVEELEVDEEEERALSLFMRAKSDTRKTLSEIVSQKLKEQEERLKSVKADQSAPQHSSLHPKVFAVYKGVGKILQRWTSGKLPKAFKIIPSLRNWEEMLYVTNPDEWSPASFYQATRIFSANLNNFMSQRFYNTILLPKVRDDMSQNRKLNFHLYRALRRATFRPSAFYKGIIIPLCEEGDVTLKEATIISSIIAKVSVPVLETSACLMKLAQLPYAGATSLFIRVMLNKKYALPYRVIDELVVHFSTFIQEERLLPVLWHQSLLTFIQRYKNDLSLEQKEVIKAVCRAQTHSLITPEVRRELLNSVSRGEKPRAFPSSSSSMFSPRIH